jgi:hypothetical protein
VPISVECPGCQKRLKAKDELVGKRVKCPACGSPVTIASAPAPVAAQTPEPLPLPPDPVPRKKRRPEREDDRERDDGRERERPRNRMRDRDDDYEDGRGRRPARDKLRGVTPHYRVNLGRWLSVALPHYKVILGPTVGYMFLFSFLIAIWWVVGVVAIGAIATISRVGALVAAPFVVLPVAAAFPALALGVHVVCQKQLKEERWGFGTFFSGFNWMWRLVGRAMLLTLVEVAAMLPVVAIQGISAAIGSQPPLPVIAIGTAAALGCSIVGFYALFRLTVFSHLLMIDRDCGVIESLRGSWTLTRGHFWSLFGVSLATMLVLNVFAFAAVGVSLAFPSAVIVSIPLMLMGAIFQLFALPALVLVLNAGYLLVAGKEPLPDQEPGSERVEKRPASILGWLPVPAVAAAVVLLGVGVMMLEASNREHFEQVMQRDRERAQQQAERAKERDARNRALLDQEVKDLVTFIREGGYWSVEAPGWEGDPAAAASGIPSGPAGSPPGVGSPMGSTATGRPDVEPVGRKRRILVFGPRKMLNTDKTVRVGVPLAPNPEWGAKAGKFEGSLFNDSMTRKAFYEQFAEAMAGGDVEVALAVAVVNPRRFDPPGPGSPTGPSGTESPFPPAAVNGPDQGNSPAPGSEWHGVAVTLDKAELLTRERFLKLVENPYGPP